jgi:hypothetical protein
MNASYHALPDRGVCRRYERSIVLHFLYEWFDIVVISLKNIGVPAIDGLATNWGRNADAQAESATAV